MDSGSWTGTTPDSDAVSRMVAVSVPPALRRWLENTGSPLKRRPSGVLFRWTTRRWEKPRLRR